MKRFLYIILLSTISFQSFLFSNNYFAALDFLSLNKMSDDQVLKTVINQTYKKDINVNQWVNLLVDFGKRANNKRVSKIISRLIEDSTRILYKLNKKSKIRKGIIHAFFGYGFYGTVCMIVNILSDITKGPAI